MVHKLLFCFNGLISQVRGLLSSFASRNRHSPSVHLSHPRSQEIFHFWPSVLFQAEPAAPTETSPFIVFRGGLWSLSVIAKGCHPQLVNFRAAVSGQSNCQPAPGGPAWAERHEVSSRGSSQPWTLHHSLSLPLTLSLIFMQYQYESALLRAGSILLTFCKNNFL